MTEQTLPMLEIYDPKGSPSDRDAILEWMDDIYGNILIFILENESLPMKRSLTDLSLYSSIQTEELASLINSSDELEDSESMFPDLTPVFFKYLYRIGYVFKLKDTVTHTITNPNPIVLFLLWIGFTYSCYHPGLFLFIPHLLCLIALLYHRVYLTRYDYSSDLSIAPELPYKISLQGVSLIENYGQTQKSIADYLFTFEKVIRILETWINETPPVTFEKWFLWLSSLLGLILTIEIIPTRHIFAFIGTFLYLSSFPTLKRIALAIHHELAIKSTLSPPYIHYVVEYSRLISHRLIHTFLANPYLDIFLGNQSKPFVQLTPKPRDISKFLVAKGSILEASCYENERWWLGLGWTCYLTPQERSHFSNEQGTISILKEEFSAPQGWKWLSEWYIDTDFGDVHGWSYSDNSWQLFSSEPRWNTFTRRRRWMRFLQPTL